MLITFLTVEKVAGFENDFKVGKYSNIITGTEGLSFFVRDYYKLTDIPFAALYNQNGNLIISYQQNIPLNGLVNKLKKLK